ncbi:Cytochrome P450 94A1 [Acorus calamus]|uniref:Cytochrome P450 94A1 n=1 Tax=Acorus calamus TaxID=4465 RepID=A0AAV9DF93_ACOCL|nr:Cytochrome P450 94A1 [Acorus calamus]
MEEAQTLFCVANLTSLFFSFTISFITFSFFLFFLLRTTNHRSWCACSVCRAYVSRSWTSTYPNLCDWYTHLLRLSPTHTVDIHVLGSTVTADPSNVEHLLRTRFDNYPKGKPFSSILGDLLGRGIFNVDGDAWRFQRKMASLELGSVSVRSYAFRIMTSEISSRLVPLLDSFAVSRRVFDLQDVFRRFAFDNICRISFGLDPGCLELSLPISDFASAFDLASGLSAGRAVTTSPFVWKLKRFLGLGSERDLARAIRLVDELAREVIKQKRKLRGMGSEDQDLLSRFMGSTDDDDYLRDIVISFLLAGRDTVASALVSYFFLLSTHPEVEAAVRDEIINNDDDGHDHGGLEGLRGMHYVHASMYESLRLYPPVQFDSKFALEDDVLPDGTAIGKGTRVTYHPYAMGRMESIWGADCLEFHPERWLKEGLFTPVSPFKFPVFQAGARVCLGKELALMEMKSVIVSIVRRFEFEAVKDDRELKFAPGLTATVSGGLPVRVRRRRSGL